MTEVLNSAAIVQLLASVPSLSVEATKFHFYKNAIDCGFALLFICVIWALVAITIRWYNEHEHKKQAKKQAAYFALQDARDTRARALGDLKRTMKPEEWLAFTHSPEFDEKYGGSYYL